MTKTSSPPAPRIGKDRRAIRWLALLGGTMVLTWIFKALGMPAHHMLGAIGAGVGVAVFIGQVRMSKAVFSFGQATVGCLIAGSIAPTTLRDILGNWPLFVLMVLSASIICGIMGWLLAKANVLPGTTAVWGTSPGAALVMVLMSGNYGADSRLVAMMQYLRVFMVTMTATMVAKIMGMGDAAPAAVPQAWWPGIDALGFAETIGLIAISASLGMNKRLPSAPILFPLIIGPVLRYYDLVAIDIPWWLLTAAYAIVGWNIGLRFTRDIVLYSLRVLPIVIASTAVIIVVCGIVGMIFGPAAGMDPLTAYLATSPGGIDTVAIIGAATNANLSLIMAVQTTRFIVVAVTGPAFATFIVKRTGMLDRKDVPA